METACVPQPGASAGLAGLLEVVAPLVAAGRARLEEQVRVLAAGHPGRGPLDPGTATDLLLPGLHDRLLTLLGRTLILELHVAKMQGLLAGATAEERFADFVDRLRQPEAARSLLNEYPVLERRAARCVDLWAAAGSDFLKHLCHDWPDLCATFAGGDPGPLAAVAAGSGDSHRGGRCVLFATFASGLQLVYKPRSLAVDAHFQELLAWANRRGAALPFRTVRLLDRADHGWVEFVEPQGCATREEVGCFYLRLGGLLALVHALAGSDLHYENLVAAGEHPVLVDLEVLFHPHPPGWSGREPAVQALADSVLGTGLLPSADADGGVDISGLGAGPGQTSAAAVTRVEELGTDDMRVVRQHVELPAGRHRPTLAGAPADPLDHQAELSGGFAETYRLLLEHRDDLLAAGGLLDRCRHDEVRYVARPTRTYAILLEQAGHPDRLRDEGEQARLFDRLKAGVAHHPTLRALLPHEVADLDSGDVPLFTARPGSLDLWAASGEQIAGFFEGNGLDRVRRRLAAMGAADLARQLSVIDAALATLPGAGRQQHRPSYSDADCRVTREELERLAFGCGGPPLLVFTPEALQNVAPGRAAHPGSAGRCYTRTRSALIDAARAIGDRLEELAWRNGAEIGWLGLTTSGQGRWGIEPLGADLYDGLPGVALFLARLGALTGEGRYTVLARQALAALGRRLGQPESPLRRVGAFDGWGGVIYTLTHLGVLWGELALIQQAEQIAAGLPPLIDRDQELDLIGGAAGCLLTLLGLHKIAASGAVLAAAVRCGERLLATAVQQTAGLGWHTPLPATAPLTGLAHGAAGIAWTLLELAAVTGDERFRVAALGAVEYERAVFDATAGNWPDFRAGNPKRPCAVAWCHGAAGIGLARLRSLRHLDDDATRGEIAAAVAATRAGGFGHNHTLCHGDFGNLELLLEAGQVLGEPDLLAEAAARAGQILGSIKADGRLCATPGGRQSPGLMTGLAGIGYGLLRLAEPQRVPSVLLLDGPGEA